MRSQGGFCVTSTAGRDITLMPNEARTAVHVRLEGGGEGDVPFDMLVAALEAVRAKTPCPACGEGTLERLDFPVPSSPTLVCGDCDAVCVMERTESGFVPRATT